MAKYTERYIDYVRGGGKIPASFALIKDFEKLFLMKYANREIGFETEDAFFLQLDLRAELAIPLYKERIDRVKLVGSKLDEPVKTYTTTGNTSSKMGERRATEHILPYDVATAKPSNLSTTNATTDSSDSTSLSKQEGFTPDEAMRVIDFAKKSVGETELIEELLDEFSMLFMGVF